MFPKLTTNFDTYVIERDRMIAQAERSRQATEAISLHQRKSIPHALRQTVGDLLVTIGKRLQAYSTSPRLAEPVQDLGHGRS